MLSIKTKYYIQGGSVSVGTLNVSKIILESGSISYKIHLYILYKDKHSLFVKKTHIKSVKVYR